MQPEPFTRDLLAFTIAAFLFIACSWPPAPPTEPPPVPAWDAGADDSAVLCARACTACPVDSPGPDIELGTDDDVPCQQACRDQVAADPTLDELLRCTAAAGSCERARRCEEQVP